MWLKNWIDVCVLFILGFFFNIIFPGLPYHSGFKPDFILAGLFVIVLVKANLQFSMIAAFFAGILSALIPGFADHIGYNFLAVFLTGCVLHFLVNYLRRFKINSGILICSISFIGTLLYKLAYVLITGTSFLKVFHVYQILLSSILNTGTAYMFYITLEYANRILAMNAAQMHKCT